MMTPATYSAIIIIMVLFIFWLVRLITEVNDENQLLKSQNKQLCKEIVGLNNRLPWRKYPEPL